MNVLWHWITMGPYHFARMNALAAQPGIDLTVVESTSVDDHHWRRGGEAASFRIVTLSDQPRSSSVLHQTALAFREALEQAAPDVIVASGYKESWSRRAVLSYARRYPLVRTLFWTESTSIDRTHYWLLDRFKSHLVRQFDGALAAGASHADYTESLGMARERVAVVGDCVDNRFFSAGKPAGVSLQPYFLYVGRFVPQKNLPMLLDAYSRYRRASRHAWRLVLVGGEWTGPRVDGVEFAGLKQPAELPAIYAAAGCFVLPSLSEPWGLVVNEAMASGLPVLVSARCGCARDLVRDGCNGFLFNPTQPDELAYLMEVISSGLADRAALGAVSRQIVSEFTVERFAARAAAHLRKLPCRKAA